MPPPLFLSKQEEEMKIKHLICAVVLMGLFVSFGSLFPVKKITLHDRECVVMISRIYPNVQQGDCAITKSGKVIDVRDTTNDKKYYGRIIISTTEGIL